MKMTDEQKAMAKFRRQEKKAARRLAWLTSLAEQEAERRGWHRVSSLLLARRYSWQKVLFLAAATIQEAHASNCEAALANDSTVSFRAAAAQEAARQSLECVRKMLMPFILGECGGNLIKEEEARELSEEARGFLVGFPRAVVSRIPTWGNCMIERHRKRPFEELSEDSLPSDPAVLIELAGVFRWQKQVLMAAADVLSGWGAEYAVEADRLAVNGPLPFEGVVAGSVAPIAKGVDAMNEIREALTVLRECGTKKNRHECKMLLAGNFPGRLMPLVPPIVLFHNLKTKREDVPDVGLVENPARGWDSGSASRG